MRGGGTAEGSHGVGEGCAEGRTKVPSMCMDPSASSVGVLGSRLACRAGFLLLTRVCDRSGSQFSALGGPG
jgi:hypothetical protein